MISWVKCRASALLGDTIPCMNEKLSGPFKAQEWVEHPANENVWALLQESAVADFATIPDKQELDTESKAKLREAIGFVKDNLKELLDARKKNVGHDLNIEYLNQIGGPKTYLASLVLNRLVDTVSSVEQFGAIYDAHVMNLFWHAPGTDSYKRKIEQRLADK